MNNIITTINGKNEDSPEPDQVFFVVCIAFHLYRMFGPKIVNNKES